ncbi:MAG: hypothetical protein PHQ27_02425 [Victivallales bacterium]|nr:hypothetical protein [Victivallales bacterium]
MSGTLAHRRRQAEARDDRIARLENYNAAQSRLLILLMEIAGWTRLDAWLTDTLAAARTGTLIDLDKLDAAIAAWKADNSATVAATATASTNPEE